MTNLDSAASAGSDQRLRFNIELELLHDDQRCATMSGVYVVWLK